MFSLLLRKCLKEAMNDCEETKRLLQWSRRDIMVAGLDVAELEEKQRCSRDI